MHPFERSPLHPEHATHDASHTAHEEAHHAIETSRDVAKPDAPKAPQIGDIVHYVESPYVQHRAAIVIGTRLVTRSNQEAMQADLMIFAKDGDACPVAIAIPFDDHEQVGTWHYPEKA